MIWMSKYEEEEEWWKNKWRKRQARTVEFSCKYKYIYNKYMKTIQQWQVKDIRIWEYKNSLW